jgi:biopolymer transport protein ExbD
MATMDQTVNKDVNEIEETEDEGFISQVSIIPVIDVCLVILVILMITTPFMNIPNLTVQLPEAYTQESKEKNITVSIGADGIMAIKTFLVTPDTFLKRFLYEYKQGNDPLVIIRADKDLPYGEVENIVRIIKNAGAKRIAFGTEQKK